MSTRFEHRATFSAPASTVYSALVDREFLEDRLRQLGGKNAALLEYSVGGEARLRMRQGMDAERLPGAVRTILKGDLVVDRAEQWHPDGAAFAGTGRVSISGVPGEITSRIRVTDLAGGGSELVNTAEVRVGIPLIGGKLESVIAEHVGNLLAAEAEFTGKWLAARG